MTKTYIDELAEEIARLKEQNNKLNEMCNYWRIEETEKTMECYKLKQLLKECNLLLIKQQANDEVEHKESAELVLRIDEVLNEKL